VFLEDDFFGTFAPSFLASDRPMAMACLRLFTFLPDPLRSLPCLRSRMARSTFLPAFLEYFAMIFFWKGMQKLYRCGEIIVIFPADLAEQSRLASGLKRRSLRDAEWATGE